MKPDVDQTLRAVAARLLAEVAPRLDPYGRGTTEMIAVLLMAAAEEFDRAADLCTAENDDLRALFRKAALDAPAEIAERLRAAAGEREESLRVSALERSNERLCALLIELHALVEERDDAWAKQTERAIWDRLRRSVERRALSFYPF